MVFLGIIFLGFVGIIVFFFCDIRDLLEEVINCFFLGFGEKNDRILCCFFFLN